MLQKPSRGWYVAPGGKMEVTESIKQSVTREFKEETGLVLQDPQLRGAFTVIIEEQGKVVDEWMMFTFYCEEFSGQLLEHSEEGKLEWVPMNAYSDLPMAPGDYHIFDHILESNQLIYGTFTYTEDFTLISIDLDPPRP